MFMSECAGKAAEQAVQHAQLHQQHLDATAPKLAAEVGISAKAR